MKGSRRWCLQQKKRKSGSEKDKRKGQETRKRGSSFFYIITLSLGYTCCCPHTLLSIICSCLLHSEHWVKSSSFHTKQHRKDKKIFIDLNLDSLIHTIHMMTVLQLTAFKLFFHGHDALIMP